MQVKKKEGEASGLELVVGIVKGKKVRVKRVKTLRRSGWTDERRTTEEKTDFDDLNLCEHPHCS